MLEQKMVNQLAVKPPSRKKTVPKTETNSVSPTRTNVRVVVRVRPKNTTECLGNHQNVVRVMDEQVVVFDPNDEIDPNTFIPSKRARTKSNIMDRRVKDLRFIFDRVFDEKSTNQDVFDHTTRNIIEGVLNGYNCTVFAYGATGAGKTHTMLGNEGTPGVMFLTMMELYSRIDEMKEQEKTCEVAVSYLEVYNETIRDLLMPGKPLAVREDPQRGVCVTGLTLHQPRSAEELFGMLEYGNRNRSQHPTDANATSSRSHAVFQVFVRQKNQRSGLKTDIQVAKMSLVDLAGSERATVTKNRGARFREGANINKSLLALGNCINALAENQGKNLHVPYRDSKLTRILKDSLGGNCRTVMIAAVSPSNLSYEDTYNTLKYADRAKSIESSLVKNVVSVDVHVSRYAKLAKELQDEVARLRTKLNRFESGDATPLKRNLGQARNKEEMEKLKSNIKTVYDERSAIKKNLVDTECLEKELMEKLQRKQKNVEWMNLLCQGENKTSKVETRVRKCLSATKSRMKRLKVRKEKLEGQLRQNDEWLQRTHNEVKLFENNDDTSCSPSFLTVYESSCLNELKQKEAQQQCKYYEKCLTNYESQRKREKRLIDTLLKFVRKQFAVLKSSGMATSDSNEDYDSIISLVEDNREVAWADQSSQPIKSSDPDDVIKMIDNSLSLSTNDTVTPGRTPRKPILACSLTPRRVKTPTLVLSSTLNKDFVSPFAPRTNIPPTKPDLAETSSVRQNLLNVLNESGSTSSTTTTAVDLSSTKSDLMISSGTPSNAFSLSRSMESKGNQAGLTSATAVSLSSTKSDVMIVLGTPSNPFAPSRSLETRVSQTVPSSTTAVSLSSVRSDASLRSQEPRESQAVRRTALCNTARSISQSDRGGMSTSSFLNRFQPKQPVNTNRSLPLREHNGPLNNRTFSLNDQSTVDNTSALRQKTTNTTLGGDNVKKVPSYASLTKSAAQKITSRDMLPKRSHSKENSHPQPKRRKVPRSSSVASLDQSSNGEKHIKNHVNELKRAVSMLHNWRK